VSRAGKQGREAGRLELLLRQLTRRWGSLGADTRARVQQFGATQLLDLADALLDFSSADDLEQWLASHTPDEPA